MNTWLSRNFSSDFLSSSSSSSSSSTFVKLKRLFFIFGSAIAVWNSSPGLIFVNTVVSNVKIIIVPNIGSLCISSNPFHTWICSIKIPVRYRLVGSTVLIGSIAPYFCTKLCSNVILIHLEISIFSKFKTEVSC